MERAERVYSYGILLSPPAPRSLARSAAEGTDSVTDTHRPTGLPASADYAPRSETNGTEANASLSTDWRYAPGARSVATGEPPRDDATLRRVEGPAQALSGDTRASAAWPAQRDAPVPAWRAILGRGWPLILLVLSKLKFLVILLKFPAFGTFATMAVSLAVYAVAFGLPFAIGFIALLFVHEMGHAIVLKHQGVRATAPLFIPFFGAVIGMRELPKDVYAEAQMALGGPIIGSLGALLLLIGWQATGHPLLLALAYVGFWLNLFNLIPLSPLDGGRAMAAISPFGWILGLAVMLLVFLRVHSLFLGLILVMGAVEVFRRWRARDTMLDYYTITPRRRLMVGVVYFGLAALLALAAAALQPHLLTNRPGG